jgi:virulence-associated protein VagC
MRTRVFKSGNSMALRIPKKFGAREGEVSIEQVGERWIVEPLVAATWPKGFFRKIRIEDPGFTRPEQGDHRDFAG